MTDKTCSVCCKPAKYLRPETAMVCKACRLKSGPVKNHKVCWLEKACAKCGTTKQLDQFNLDSSKKDGHCGACRTCNHPTGLRLHRGKKHRNRLLDSWYDAKRGTYTGTLEEYAEHWERARMGCHAAGWRSWEAASIDIQSIRDRAQMLQRPLRRPGSRSMVWPTNWSKARCWQWRYQHEPDFRADQVLRTKVRKFTNPSYAGESEIRPDKKIKWERALKQMGNVTRRHIRNESRATICPYCLDHITASNRQLDHVDPLSSGGAHDNSNIIGCCSKCNQSKGRKPLVAWLMSRFETSARHVA